MTWLRILVLVMAILASPGPAGGQVGDGFIGVFGDPYGTIPCMTAPPGVPTTLYVVGKTLGASTEGIRGAEFRIQVDNPDGYLMFYAAPDSAVIIGNPLDGTGLSIAFPSCQVPVAGTVSLGTISAFNTGSGGNTFITVKRRNPPTNEEYPCALFILCDDPAYSKSCLSAPIDSLPCLAQKGTSLAVSSSDELTTVLEGAGGVNEDRKYAGFRRGQKPHGYEMAKCDIDLYNPAPYVGGKRTMAFVGIDNNLPGFSGSEWQFGQAGWIVRPGYSWPNVYYEYVDKRGYPQGHSGIQEEPVPGPPPSGGVFGVEKDGDVLKFLAFGTPLHEELWKTFPGPMWGLYFGCEYVVDAGTDAAINCSPGNSADPCEFANATSRLAGESQPEAPGFSGASCREVRDQPEAKIENVTADAFELYDNRSPCPPAP